MYKAIKKFEVNGQTFQIGDDFPVELFEERLHQDHQHILYSRTSKKHLYSFK